PIPFTSVICSTETNGPCCSRYSTIACAFFAPIPTNPFCNCSAVAVFKFTLSLCAACWSCAVSVAGGGLALYATATEPDNSASEPKVNANKCFNFISYLINFQL